MGGFKNKDLATMAGKMSSREGVPNKASSQVREAFKQLVQSNLPQMQSDLDSLEPKDRLKFILDMAKFILPTLQAVSVNDLRESEAKGFNVLTINLTTNGNDTDN